MADNSRINDQILSSKNIRSAVSDETNFVVFYEKKDGEESGSVLVVEASDQDSVNSATKEIGEPIAKAEVKGGVINLGGMRPLRCLG